MATTTPWLPGWPAVRPRPRAAGARATQAPSGPALARGERVLLARGGAVATERALYRRAAVDDGPVGDARGPDRAGDPTDTAAAGAARDLGGRLLDSTPLPLGWARLGWEQVCRADPHERGLVLTAWAPGLPRRTVVDAPRPGPLLALARERIAWTTLIATRVPIGGHPARLAARRVPATDDVVWLVALDPAVRPSPAVEAEVEAALARLRREFAGYGRRGDGSSRSRL